MKSLKFKSLLATLAISTALPQAASAAEEVNIYSYRQSFLIEPMLTAFTNETGIKTNVVFSKKGLLERLENEGRNSPADLLLTADIGPLYDAVQRGLTQPVDNSTLKKNIPEHFRGDDNQWFGLTSRARIIYASKERVPEGAVKTYEDLADPKWKGRICTRSGKHTYNLSLIASMIVHKGEDQTREWLAAVKENLARKPQGNDRAQVKAVKEGICDLALGNSYYFGKMITNAKNPEQIEWAQSVNLIFPNQDGRGTHMNISGAALAKHAPNKANAIKLMEFLSGSMAQYMYAQENFEFPVKPGTPKSSLINQYMGNFKGDDVSLSRVAENRTLAAKLVDQVGFDN